MWPGHRAVKTLMITICPTLAFALLNLMLFCVKFSFRPTQIYFRNHKIV